MSRYFLQKCLSVLLQLLVVRKLRQALLDERNHASFPDLPSGISIEEQPLGRNVKRFRGGLVFKAHRLLYHSTLGSRVINTKKKIELVVSSPCKRRRGLSRSFLRFEREA